MAKLICDGSSRHGYTAAHGHPIAERTAAAAAALSASDIGAVIVYDAAIHAHVRRWRVRLSDGRLFGWLTVEAHGSDTDEISHAQVGALVQRVAASAPEHDGLTHVEQLSPVVRPSTDFQP